MNLELLFINWNPSEIIGHLGPITLRWYGMCWLVGIVGAYFMVRWLYNAPPTTVSWPAWISRLAVMRA